MWMAHSSVNMIEKRCDEWFLTILGRFWWMAEWPRNVRTEQKLNQFTSSMPNGEQIRQDEALKVLNWTNYAANSIECLALNQRQRVRPPIATVSKLFCHFQYNSRHFAANKWVAKVRSTPWDRLGTRVNVCVCVVGWVCEYGLGYGLHFKDRLLYAPMGDKLVSQWYQLTPIICSKWPDPDIIGFVYTNPKTILTSRFLPVHWLANILRCVTLLIQMTIISG